MQAVAEVAKMWNKLSIRIKVTLLTAAVLCIISLLLFIFNVENAANIFIIPDNVDVPFNSDASFSFDGVIGAFAITSSVLLIVAGLGAGAIWVRSLTVYLLRTGMLSKYKYLENGAHWAIMALGMMMIAKLFQLELPEWATGGLGLLFVSLAVGSSILEARAINLQEAAAAKLHNAERRLKHGAARIVPRKRR